MHKIVDVFNSETELHAYSRMVPLSEIQNEGNDFNLNLSRYIDGLEPEDIQDLQAHIHGGIPNSDIDALASYWKAFPSLRLEIFRPLREGYSEIAVHKKKVHIAVTESVEYQEFRRTNGLLIDQWWNSHREELRSISSNSKPVDFITKISEDILKIFEARHLVDEYAVYEQVMSYWHQTLNDDITLILSEGWTDAAKPRTTIENKERKLSETPDLTIGSGKTSQKFKMDLIPPDLIASRYFANEKANLEALNNSLESAISAVEEFIEENSGEDGFLADFLDDGKITKTIAVAALREAKLEDPQGDEVAVLKKLVELFETESNAKKKTREAESALANLILAQYGQLATADIQELVLEAKWGATLKERMQGEISSLISRLISRVTELSERYDETLENLHSLVAQLNGIVSENLSRIGVK
jgi:type I restriction enzyme M protein